MTRKALLLFIAASVIWGSSFLFIRLAVEHMPPATVVFGRTLLGAAFLVPLAASRRALRGLRPVIVPIIVAAVLDMAAPASGDPTRRSVVSFCRSNRRCTTLRPVGAATRRMSMLSRSSR